MLMILTLSSTLDTDSDFDPNAYSNYDLDSAAFTSDSASPTCRRSVTSIALLRRLRIINCKGSVNPWGAGPLPLMTADCYCRGSDELESLFKCRYTSVPYPSMLISLRSPPKYLAYRRDMGRP